MIDDKTREYYLQRIDTERQLAATSQNPAAATVHSALAEAYAARLDNAGMSVESKRRH